MKTQSAVNPIAQSLALLNAQSVEIANIITQSVGYMGEELKRLTEVQTRTLEIIDALQHGKILPFAYADAFSRNLPLCMGAYTARLTEDLYALTLINRRLFELATGKECQPI